MLQQEIISSCIDEMIDDGRRTPEVCKEGLKDSLR